IAGNAAYRRCGTGQKGGMANGGDRWRRLVVCIREYGPFADQAFQPRPEFRTVAREVVVAELVDHDRQHQRRTIIGKWRKLRLQRRAERQEAAQQQPGQGCWHVVVPPMKTKRAKSTPHACTDGYFAPAFRSTMARLNQRPAASL